MTPKDWNKIHNEVCLMLKNIGEKSGFIVKEEYPTLLGRIDLVWKNVNNNIVYAVQVGGTYSYYETHNGFSRLKEKILI